MAKGHKPRAGSRAFWPRKRAKRIYPRLKAGPSKEPKASGFAAYKAGMTRAVIVDTKKESVTQGQEVIRVVTVLDCPPLVVCGIKAYESGIDGLKELKTVWHDKLGKDFNRKTRIPKKPKAKADDIEKALEGLAEVRLLVHTKPRESGVRKKKPELFEIPIGGDVKEQWEYAKGKLGSELKVSDVFAEGDWIDAMAVSKGKGFQGPVKRFNVTIRPRKHEKKRRHVGNLGACGPARVFPGSVAMPGQMGFQTRTEWNKRVLKVGNEGIEPKGGFLYYGKVPGDYLLLDGSVPGARKRLIMLRPGLRAPAQKEPVQLKEVDLTSPQ